MQGRTQGADQVRLVRDHDGRPQMLFQQGAHARVMGHPAGKQHRLHHPHPVQHGQGPLDDGQVQAQGNIGLPPRAMSEVALLSANTVHMLLI